MAAQRKHAEVFKDAAPQNSSGQIQTARCSKIHLKVKLESVKAVTFSIGAGAHPENTAIFTTASQTEPLGCDCTLP